MFSIKMILEACHCNSRVMEAFWWAGDFTSLSTQSFSSQETPQSQEKLDRWSSYDNYLFHILSLSLLFTMLCKLETWLFMLCGVCFLSFFLSLCCKVLTILPWNMALGSSFRGDGSGPPLTRTQPMLWEALQPIGCAHAVIILPF